MEEGFCIYERCFPDYSYVSFVMSAVLQISIVHKVLILHALLVHGLTHGYTFSGINKNNNFLELYGLNGYHIPIN